jgi:hypothetical protein
MIPKPIRWESPKYEAYVRNLPCIICGGPAEPHHAKGIGGLSGVGLKAPSWAVMPLCRLCHESQHRNPTEEQWEYIARTLGRAVEQGILKI